MVHIPVMVREVLDALKPIKGKVILDATLGGGGHSKALLDEAKGDITLIGIDRDPEALEIASKVLSDYADKVILVHSLFSDMEDIVRKKGFEYVDRILFDLGVSSFALDSPKRGFGFTTCGPLDMRMDRTRGEPASKLINEISEYELAKIIWEFGEDRFAKRIAKAIVKERKKSPITTTTRLAEIVARAVPHSPKSRIHPATRTFQALRIAVNRELDQLREGLKAAHAVLRPGGRVCVISFHSLEDRIVKKTFKKLFKPIYAKPITPSRDEIKKNRRARSAKLRVAEKVEDLS